jgi:hypothetical protein
MIEFIVKAQPILVHPLLRWILQVLLRQIFSAKRENDTKHIELEMMEKKSSPSNYVHS